MSFEAEPKLVNFLDHFLNPRNVGKLADADAAGEAGSFSCGGMMQVSLRINESQEITDVRFQAIGCSSLVSCASIITETVKGRTTAEAAALAQSPPLSQLGSIPQEKPACYALCCDALLSAVQNFSDAKRAQWNGDDALICTCFGVAESTIEREIEAGKLTTIAEVTRACRAGAGCRSCYSLIGDILDDFRRSKTDAV
jgi:NifU-like protein